jgi:fructan beta-fructosidase
MRLLALLIVLNFSASLFAQQNFHTGYKEAYRPQLHFSPAKNWTNDPNGPVYYKGEYHLFFQYNPFGDTWGHMSWGHTVSKDLIKWKQLPLAIPEDSNNMIFSGSCVIDKENTSRFATKPGQVPMVATYTAHIIPDKSKPDDYWQNQHIAFSLDNGRTWKKYKGNPVLDQHKKDFRDPNVFWYGPEKKWIMAVVLPHEHKVQFYSSKNLKQWDHLSDFGPAGDTSDIWECPGLLKVPVVGKANEFKWVLINSQQTTMQYFVGNFDGKYFKSENPAGLVLRPDYGADNYAGIPYNNIPAGQAPIFIGWANNWKYAAATPTSPWRCAMTLPREMSLKKINGVWYLLQQPAGALKNYRLSEIVTLKNTLVIKEKELPVHNQLMEIELIIKTKGPGSCGIKLAAGNGNFFTIGYKSRTNELYTDRTNSGNTTFHPAFSSWLRSSVKLPQQKEMLKLHIIYDESIVEIYANDGEAVMTEQIFPDKKNNGVILFSDGGKTIFDSVKIWNLKSSWR